MVGDWLFYIQRQKVALFGFDFLGRNGDYRQVFFLNILLRFPRAGHIAVIGNGNASEAARQCQINDPFGIRQTVKGIFAVYV
jgi:hypothetical protein